MDSKLVEAELAGLLEGLAQPQKKISPKYFYDERGSDLFEQICKLPEYYLTRTEIGIMRESAPEMATEIGPGVNVIEFGIGSGLKTQLLLEALHDPVAFIPVDISAEHLAATTESLSRNFPNIEMLPVAADFTQTFPVPEPGTPAKRNLVYFPGSTIGNFEDPQAKRLLRVMRNQAGPDGLLLIGIDLKKNSYLIDNAYNDTENITALFNLNILHHLNREFGAGFNVAAFRHSAVYDDSAGRIEMRLISETRQHIHLGGQVISFEKGETILTEYSHKYVPGIFQQMVESEGFQFRQSWQDRNNWFSVQLYSCR